MLTPGKLTKSMKMPPPFLFHVFLTGRNSTPELQNSCVNFDPTWGEHIRHWKWGPQQQAGRHQHLQFCVWESDPSPFPCLFGPHLNETCSLPSNLFSSFLSCFQVSWFAFQCLVMHCGFEWLSVTYIFHNEILWFILNLLLTGRLAAIFHPFLSGLICFKMNFYWMYPLQKWLFFSCFFSLWIQSLNERIFSSNLTFHDISILNGTIETDERNTYSCINSSASANQD